MRDTYRQRRALVVEALRKIEGVNVQEPAGTFYAFPGVSQLLKRGSKLADVDRLCDWLLEEHGLALVPGTAFGDERCVRISFAASASDLTRGLQRLSAALR
jgi:aspartate aminotransferase